MGTITKAIGKNTLGDGKKMNVDLKTYNRSTKNRSYVWRNTQAPGTLVPFMCELALPGDIDDIELNVDVMTHPTVGPLFGSYKLQLDVFSCPIRLYNAALHNNALKIGLKMSQIKLPIAKVTINKNDCPTSEKPNEFTQINPSCILAYLGQRGYGVTTDEDGFTVSKQQVPLLSYWDIFKNYYANKQEDVAYYVSQNGAPTVQWCIKVEGGIQDCSTDLNKDGIKVESKDIGKKIYLQIFYCNSKAGRLDEKYLIEYWTGNPGYETRWVKLEEIAKEETFSCIADTYNQVELKLPTDCKGTFIIAGFKNGKVDEEITLKTFPLENLDDIRRRILMAPETSAFVLPENLEPFSSLFTKKTSGDKKLHSTLNQYGLAVKTYQSDILQNWINTEWIDGEQGINKITAIDTSTGSFTLDTLNLAQKVYDMLNRIAISGGTYRDWIETVYTNEYVERAETPTYEGGLSQEIIFQEVISQSASENEPLGTLAGRGSLAGNKKGGKLHIKTSEPCYLIGIASITPRIDYSQGNNWDTNLLTLDDLHKPALDSIGFQDLITDWMHWADTKITNQETFEFRAVGKQPAWLQYMTNINKCYGNFAINDSEAFMVLNRNYEIKGNGSGITDLTTYIDPAKFNYVFADARLDAQNFWVQIGVSWESRRKMTDRIIPNL